ncbi:cell surface glycoprotein 1-like [Lucilia sericata]|uniref:cell surface glycoprotein 1-like n=1 Tax=Lucilia sericata TaxID=13632 RepID=UPI0018A811F0|nr:cell surface glycoprotein 1-like [Lucilia sericata]
MLNEQQLSSDIKWNRYFMATVAQMFNNFNDLNSIVICATLNNANRTFDNIWQVYNEYKLTGQVWTPVALGACPVNSPDCTVLNPVCAVSRNNFFKTFPNLCVLEAEQRATGTEWRIVFNGICSANPGDGFATSTAAPPVTPAPAPWYARFLGNTQQGQPSLSLPFSGSLPFATVPVQNNQQQGYTGAIAADNNQNIAQPAYPSSSGPIPSPFSHNDPACDPAAGSVPSSSYSTSSNMPGSLISPLCLPPPANVNPDSIPFNTIPLSNPALSQLFSTLQNTANSASHSSYSVPSRDPLPALPSPSYPAPNPDCPPTPSSPTSSHYNSAPAPLPSPAYSSPTISDNCNPVPSAIPGPYDPAPVPSPAPGNYNPTNQPAPAYGGPSSNPTSSYNPNPFDSVPIPAPSPSYSTASAGSSPAYSGTSSNPAPSAVPGSYDPTSVPSPSYSTSSSVPSSVNYNPAPASVPPYTAPSVNPIPGTYEPSPSASGNYNAAPAPQPPYSIPSVNPEHSPIPSSYDSVPAPSPSYSIPTPGSYDPQPAPQPSYTNPAVNPEPSPGSYDSAPQPSPAYPTSSSNQVPPAALPSVSGDCNSVPAPQPSLTYPAASTYAAPSPISGDYTPSSIDNKPSYAAILSDPGHSNNQESVPFNTVPLTNPALIQIFSPSAAAPTSSPSPSYSVPSSNSPQSYAPANSLQSEQASYAVPSPAPAPSPAYPQTGYNNNSPILTDPIPSQFPLVPALGNNVDSIPFNTIPLTNRALLQIYPPSTPGAASTPIAAPSPAYTSNPSQSYSAGDSSQPQQSSYVPVSLSQSAPPAYTSPAVSGPEVSSSYSNPSEPNAPSIPYPQQPDAGQVPCDNTDSLPFPLILPAPLVPSLAPPSITTSDYSSAVVSVPGISSSYSNPSESNSPSTYQQQQSGQVPYGNTDSSINSLTLTAPLTPSVGGVQFSASEGSSAYSSSPTSNYAPSEQKPYDNAEQNYQQSPQTYSSSSAKSYGSNPAEAPSVSQSYQQASNTPSDTYSSSLPSAPSAQYNAEPYNNPIAVPAADNAPCSNAESYISPVLNYENVPSYTPTSNVNPAASDSYSDKPNDSYNNVDSSNLNDYSKSQDNPNPLATYDKSKSYDAPAADNSNSNVNNEGQTIYNGVVYQGPYYYEPKYKHINFGNFNFLPSQGSAAATAAPAPVSTAVPALVPAYPYAAVPGAQYSSYSTNPFEQLLKQLQYIATKNVINGY